MGSEGRQVNNLTEEEEVTQGHQWKADNYVLKGLCFPGIDLQVHVLTNSSTSLSRVTVVVINGVVFPPG